MSKELRQTLNGIDEKKHSIRIDAEDYDREKDPLQSIYISKSALKKVGVKNTSKIKSVDVKITIHEK